MIRLCDFTGHLPGYDEWKTRSPYDDWDEAPEFECEECEDTAFIAPGELCPACQEPATPYDLEDIAAEQDAAR